MNIPTKCPVCGADLIWKGVDLMCVNPNCSSKQYMDLRCWIMTIAPVENIGSTLVFKYLEELQINSITELHEYGSRGEEFEGNRVSEQNFRKVLDKLFNQNVDVRSALVACNVPRLGYASADKIANSEVLNELLNCCVEGLDTDLDELKGNLAKVVGPSTARSMIENINKLNNLRFLKGRITIPSNEPEMEIKGKVCITGALSIKRADFEKLLNENGYILSGIKKDTLVLITNDKDSGSSKNKMADSLGIPKMTEAEFRKTYLGE